MKSYKYFIMTYSIDPKYCLVDKDAKGVINEWNLSKGVRMGTDFPDDAKYYMSKNHRGTKLTDFIVNTINLLMVSQKVRDLMEQEGINNVEFLPFTFYDQKNKIVRENYSIANLLGTVDCVDLEKSVFVRSAIKPDKIRYFKKLILFTEKIPEDKKFFRLKERPVLHIIRSDFVKKLAQNKVTGIDLLNLGEPIMI